MNPLRRLFFAVVCLSMPGRAFAHTPVEGFGNFYNGLLHPVWVAAHLLVLIVFGLFIGQQSDKLIRFMLLAFSMALVTGLCVVAFDITFNAELTLFVASAILGILVALEYRLPLQVSLGLAIILGFIIGLDSPQEELWGISKFYALAGTCISASLCLGFFAGLAVLLKRPWQRILIRVLGSWGTASAVLVLTTLFPTTN